MGLSEGDLFDAQISNRLFRDCVMVKKNLGSLYYNTLCSCGCMTLTLVIRTGLSFCRVSRNLGMQDVYS